jgi:hypothetical protein
MKTMEFSKMRGSSTDDISMRICLYRLKNCSDSSKNWDNKILLWVTF